MNRHDAPARLLVEELGSAYVQYSFRSQLVFRCGARPAMKETRQPGFFFEASCGFASLLPSAGPAPLLRVRKRTCTWNLYVSGALKFCVIKDSKNILFRKDSNLRTNDGKTRPEMQAL